MVITYSYQWFNENKATIKRTGSDNSEVFIPIDLKNIDYQNYLEWAKTNTIQEPSS